MAETKTYPVAWMVVRDSECDPPELFATEEAARKNACLGLADTHVVPLFEGAAAPSLPSCKARAQGTPGGIDTADCDWPFCGCDPKADKVIEAIEESGLKIVQARQWYDTICGACQLMDAWKSTDPQIWTEWDQTIRDRLSKILAALSSDKVSKEVSNG